MTKVPVCAAGFSRLAPPFGSSPVAVRRRTHQPQANPVRSVYAPMKQALKVLVLEDDDNDVLLLEIALSRAGYAPKCHRVQTRKALSAALDRQAWDLIISDYVMPEYNGLEALSLVKEKGIDLPFIIVSGQVTDDAAVAAMRAGAHDYVMKDNLSRLGPAVERELHEVQLRREQRKTEEKTRAEHAITLILAHAESFEQAAPEILRILMVVLEADFGALWTPGPEGKTLQALILNRRHPTPSLFVCRAHPKFASSPGRRFAGTGVEELRAEWIADLAADNTGPCREAAAYAGLKSGVAFPILDSTAFFGVIEFFALRRLAYDATWTSMMGAISR